MQYGGDWLDIQTATQYGGDWLQPFEPSQYPVLTAPELINLTQTQATPRVTITVP